MNNARYTHLKGYEVFHVNPSDFNEDVLYKKINNNVCKKVVSPEKIKERQRRKKVTTEETANIRKGRADSPKPKSEKSDESNRVSKVSETKRDDLEKRQSKQSLTDDDTETPAEQMTKDKNKPKLQSHYQKLFSVPNKIEKNKKCIPKSNKVDILVMNVDVNNNQLVKQKSLTKETKSTTDNEPPNTKDKSMLKNIKQHYIDARTKFKNDIFSNNSGNDTSEEMDINSLKYINQNKSMTKSDTNEVVENNEIESVLKNQMRDKEVTFNATLNIEMNKFCYNVSTVDEPNKHNEEGDFEFNSEDTNLHTMDQINKTDKIVQDIGINTIPLDELMHSINKQNKTKTVSNKILNWKTSSKASGDESKSSVSSERNLSDRWESKSKDAVELKPESSHSRSSSPKRKVSNTSQSIEPSKSKIGTTKTMTSKQKEILLSKHVSRSTGSGCSKYSNHSNNSLTMEAKSEKYTSSRKSSVKDYQCKKSVSEECDRSKTTTNYTQTKVVTKSNELFDQTVPQGSKKTSNLVESLSTSKKSKSFLSCKEENKIAVNYKQQTTDQISVKSQPCTPTRKTKAACVGRNTTLKSRIPSISRSKSNLSYRSFTRSKVQVKRSVTPNPELLSKLSQLETPENSTLRGLQRKDSIQVATSRVVETHAPLATEPTSQSKRTNITHKESTKIPHRRFEKSNIPVSARQNLVISYAKNNDPNSGQPQTKRKSPVTLISKFHNKRNKENNACDQSQKENPNPKLLVAKHDVVYEDEPDADKATHMLEERSKSLTVLNSKDNNKDCGPQSTCADEYSDIPTKLAMCKDSIEVLNAKKLAGEKETMSHETNTGANAKLKPKLQYRTRVVSKVGYKGQLSKGSKYNYSKAPAIRRNLIENALEACENSRAPSDTKLPLNELSSSDNADNEIDKASSTDKSNVGSTINTERSSNKPSVTRTKVFNKIPIKIQKSTPVHTWRY